MSAAVGAALKKIAVSLLTNPKVLKIIGGIVLGILIMIIMPVVAVVSVFNGDLKFDTDRLQEMIEENLSAEEQEKLQFIEDSMYGMEHAMTEVGCTQQQVKEAQVLFMLALSDKAAEEGFMETLVGCFAAGQTEEQLIASVNTAFGTELSAAEFTKLMNRMNQRLVEVARSQLGNTGGEPYWSWYGFEERVEWCACFVSWCANECGYMEQGKIPKFSLCTDGVSWFRSHNQWLEGIEEPAPGMIIFFDRARNGQDGRADHVGIVERVENETVYTIEGNSGDACKERSYAVGYYEILGYGVPIQ